MRSRLFWMTVCAAASLCAAASAQESASAPDPAKLALARQVVAATGSPEAVKARMTAVFATMQKMVKSQLPATASGLGDIIFKYMTDEEIKTIPALLEDMSEVYAENLTETELRDMLAWLTSPSGKSVVAKTAAMNQDLLLRQAPRIKAMMSGVGSTVVDRVCADTHCTPDQRQVLTQAMQKALPHS